MKSISNTVWNAYKQRRDKLQLMLREKRLILNQPDLRQAALELRKLSPGVADVQRELAVLRRILEKQQCDEDCGGDTRGLERRFAPTTADTKPESSGAGIGETLHLRGYAVLWNDWSQDLGGFVERFMPGAFDESLRDDDQDFLIEHLPPAIATTADETLSLQSNENGLHFDARLDRRRELIQRAEPRLKERRQMSFLFKAIRDSWIQSGNVVQRTVYRAKLFEISAVKSPAYAHTSLSVQQRAWQVEAAARQKLLDHYQKLSTAPSRR